MLFSRIVSFFALFFTYGILTLGSPLESRQNADVSEIINTLQSAVTSVTPEISAFVNNGSASDATIGPLVNQLVSALNTAKSDLSSVSTSGELLKRQSLGDIATSLAAVIEAIVEALAEAEGVASGIPGLPGFLSTIDTALAEVLDGVEVLLAGVLSLVSALLVDVAALLEELSLGLTAAALGL